MDFHRPAVPLKNGEGEAVEEEEEEIEKEEEEEEEERGGRVDRNQIKGGNSASAARRNNGVCELSKRRHANDPAMMRELKRYQRLMLLTILPSISGEGEQVHLHPHARAHYADTDVSPIGTSPRATFTSDFSFDKMKNIDKVKDIDKIKDKDKVKEIDKNHNEHFPRPEPTDGIARVLQKPNNCSPQQAKSAGAQRARVGKSLSSGPASAGTRLPLTVYNPLNTSPKYKNRRKSKNENARRRRSQGDDRMKDERRAVAETGSSGGGSSEGGSVGGGNSGGGGELDLLTLAALYLESRHRVFGQEWHYRPDNPANTRPGVQLGNTGMARPRRLSPLSSNDTSSVEQEDESNRLLEHRDSFSGILHAPAGLHLSVNYTQNLDLDESSYFAERARALKPRLRRLNSLDDVVTSPRASSQHSLHRTISAPDLAHSAHTTHLYIERHDSQMSLESISMETPARANTPTGARHSAAVVKPQIVGGSLTTYSPMAAPNAPSSSNSSSLALVGKKHSGNPTRARTRTLSEGSRPGLHPPPRTGRLLGIPPDQATRLELPKAPPPSAAVENPRKTGRIQLVPLTAKKHSY